MASKLGCTMSELERLNNKSRGRRAESLKCLGMLC
ncbi:MAG: hypothetical protein E7476_04640 [Ruminococcaceae bacterium]|nr:hypothetical protein [Oscillospiraceae bacterium]